MSLTITQTQQDALCYMLQHNWISYREKDDRTLNQLHDKRLVQWNHHPERPHWVLTEQGLNIARRLRDG